ncbi:head-tail connector protein [Viridibacillus arvi]|uniref:head-tail connector protein n=1 Tax=Viridibacillus arvi TaxID=263475 RepID=UPI0034CDFE67
MNVRLLEELRGYLRVDEEDDVSLFLQSAKLYLKVAGVNLPQDLYKIVDGEDVYAEHRLAIFMLATHFYENRIVVNPSSIKIAQIAIPYGFQSILMQLQWGDINELPHE